MKRFIVNLQVVVEAKSQGQAENKVQSITHLRAFEPLISYGISEIGAGEPVKLMMDIECRACGGTGLYSGMGEAPGAAAVCDDCGGTGCYNFSMEYTPFKERKLRDDVVRVYEQNPGFGIGPFTDKNGKEHGLEDFGGIPYEDWKEGKPFPPGSEMRIMCCPARWFGSTPKWCKLRPGRSYFSCEKHEGRHECWKRHDDEKEVV